jgi:Tfp pilus assembly protein PilF
MPMILSNAPLAERARRAVASDGGIVAGRETGMFRRFVRYCALLIVVAPVVGCGTTAAVKQKVTSVIEAPRRKEETRASVARLHEKQGNLRKAEELYLALHDKKPKNAVYAHRLGNVYTRLGDTELAETYYKKALELDPKNATVLSDMGYAALLRNDLEAAEDYLSQALDYRPNDPLATNNLAMAIGLQGRTDEALRLFRRVNGEADAYANMGYVHAQRGEGQLALKRYGEALSADPNHRKAATAMVQLADIQVKQSEMIAQQNPEPAEPQVTVASATRKPNPVAGRQRLGSSASPAPVASPSEDTEVVRVAAENVSGRKGQEVSAIVEIEDQGPVAAPYEAPRQPVVRPSRTPTNSGVQAASVTEKGATSNEKADWTDTTATVPKRPPQSPNFTRRAAPAPAASAAAPRGTAPAKPTIPGGLSGLSGLSAPGE